MSKLDLMLAFWLPQSVVLRIDAALARGGRGPTMKQRQSLRRAVVGALTQWTRLDCIPDALRGIAMVHGGYDEVIRDASRIEIVFE